MTSVADTSSAARSWADRLAAIFVVLTVLWIGVMLASLRWNFLDRFSVGTQDHLVGIDFFQVPRGYQNLFHGNSILLTELSAFGPYSTPYVLHPCLAVAVGSWTSWLGPWPGYCAFVALSLGLLLLAAGLLASALEGVAWKAFAFFAMFCSIPVYYMLWAGQMHVFLVVAVALILAGLMRLEGARSEAGGERHVRGRKAEREGQRPRRVLPAGLYRALSAIRCSDPRRWVQAGVLISLLSKPTVVVMLPVLLLTRETRRYVLAPLVVYTLISLLFLVVAVLNPGGYNGDHWANMVVVSSTSKLTYWLSAPVTRDVTRHPDIYCLPVLARRLMGHPLSSAIGMLLAAIVLGLSAAPLLPGRKTRQECPGGDRTARRRDERPSSPPFRPQTARALRLHAAVVAVCACVLIHYLAYPAVCEYQYVTLLPLLPAHVWLWQREPVRGLRRLLMASFAASLLIFLPTFSFLDPADPRRYWLANSLFRVVPVAVDFACLAFYGAALAWLSTGGAALRWMLVHRHWRRERAGERAKVGARRRKAAHPSAPNAHPLSQGRKRSPAALEGRGGEPAATDGRGGGDRSLISLLLSPLRSALFRRDIWPMLRFGSAIGALVAIVLATVYETTPTRLWSAPISWSEPDWMAHFQDMVRREGLSARERALSHLALARWYARLKPDRALEHYAAAIEADADRKLVANMEMADLLAWCGRGAESQLLSSVATGSAKAHYNLGVELEDRGRLEEAIAQFRKALEMEPHDADAHYKLGIALIGSGRLEEAIEQYRKALKLNPDKAEARNNLGTALLGCGRLDDAVAQYRRALQIKPDYADAHYNLGLALAGCGRIEEAIGQYDEVLDIDPDYAKALNELAWLRATCPDAALRDGPAAVVLARRAIGLPGGRTPEFLDTLAAAYAEAGMFSLARETGREALHQAQQKGQPTLAERLDARLRLYEAEKPYREPPPSPSRSTPPRDYKP